MFRNYFKVAFRNILRQKIYSIINITGLATGLAACMVLLIWLHFHLSFDRFHDNSQTIVRQYLDINLNGLNHELHAGSLASMAPKLASELPEIKSFVRLYRIEQTARVRYGEHVQSFWDYYYSDPAFFDIFSFKLKYGDRNTCLNEPKSLVLTAESSHALFGDDNPVGRFVQVGNDEHFKITGVFEKIPPTSHFQFQVLCSYDQTWLQDKIINHNYNPDFYTYYRLAPGADLKTMETKSKPIMAQLFPAVAHGVQIGFQPLRDIHLHSANMSSDRSWRNIDISYIYIFASIAFMILAIACINYINLSTARARRRSKEVGIRKAIGASRDQLIGQFLGESLLITFAAMLMGFILLELAIPILNQMFDNELSYIQVNRLQIIGMMIALSTIVGLFTGWYPAMVLSSPSPREAISLSRTAKYGKFNLRQGLVIFQFSITMVLIITSFVISKQLSWIQNKNLGYDKENVVSFKMPAQVKKHYLSIKEELERNSWINGTSGLGPNNFTSFHGKQFDFEGNTSDEWWTVVCSAVDYEFVDFYGLEIVEGRDFSREFETDLSEGYIINETLKRKLGWETAVGKEFHILEYKDKPGRVIGVVKDFNEESLYDPIEGVALFLSPETLSYLSVRCKPEHIPDLMISLGNIWERYAPNADFERFFLKDTLARQYFSEQKTRRIVSAFSILAIFIASIGLLGLVSYSMEQRTKEVGIRKILGASLSDIMYTLTREFILLLNIAILVAWPVAWYFSKQWLHNFAYQTKVTLLIYIMAWLITLFIAILTIAGQVIRAARANPVQALHYE